MENDEFLERRIDENCEDNEVSESLDTRAQELKELHRAGPLFQEAPHATDRGWVVDSLEREVVLDVHEDEGLSGRETKIHPAPRFESGANLGRRRASLFPLNRGRHQPTDEIPSETGASEIDDDPVRFTRCASHIDSGSRPAAILGEVAEVQFAFKEAEDRVEAVRGVGRGKEVSVPPPHGAAGIEVRGYRGRGPSPHPLGLRVEGSNRGVRREGRVECDDIPEGAHSSIRPARALEPRGSRVSNHTGSLKRVDYLALHRSEPRLAGLPVERGPVVRDLHRDAGHELA